MTNLKTNNNAFQVSIPKHKLNNGCLTGKRSLRIDDRTTVYVPDTFSEKQRQEVRVKYLVRIYGAKWETVINYK